MRLRALLGIFVVLGAFGLAKSDDATGTELARPPPPSPAREQEPHREADSASEPPGVTPPGSTVQRGETPAPREAAPGTAEAEPAPDDFMRSQSSHPGPLSENAAVQRGDATTQWAQPPGVRAEATEQRHRVDLESAP